MSTDPFISFVRMHHGGVKTRRVALESGHRRRCNHSQFEDLQSSVGACSVHRVGGAWEESSQGGGRLATAQLEGGHKFVSPWLVAVGVSLCPIFDSVFHLDRFKSLPNGPDALVRCQDALSGSGQGILGVQCRGQSLHPRSVRGFSS